MVLKSKETPKLFGFSLFQDCEELEKSQTYLDNNLIKFGGKFERGYKTDKFVCDGIEIRHLDIKVGKKIKDKAQRQKAEWFKSLKSSDDPFLKSSKEYVVLKLQYFFVPTDWEKVMKGITSEFGKPTEEEIKKSPRDKSVYRMSAKWVLEDGSTIKVHVVANLGTASIDYNSNW
jgi:hypothetical protein